MIVEFDTREALDEWLKEEPFLKEGIYSHVDVKPFNKSISKRVNACSLQPKAFLACV